MRTVHFESRERVVSLEHSLVRQKRTGLSRGCREYSPNQSNMFENQRAIMQDSKLLTENEAAELRRQSVRTLQAERLRGDGCPFVKLGRSVRYRLSDVMQFIDARIRSSTTEADRKGASR
jgi:hypothetical protein